MADERIDLDVGLLDAIDIPQAYDAGLPALFSEERGRAERFAFEHRRRRCIPAHGLLRLSRSGFVPNVAPADWSFTTYRRMLP